MARVGDFYEFYFDQAETVSKACGLKLAHGKYQGKEHVFCGFPSFKMNDYVKMLIKQGFTVAKYEQYEKLQSNGQKLMTRKVDRIFSSGTVIEEDIATDEGANFIVALKAIGDQKCAFSAIDLASGKFITDHTPTDGLFQVLSSLQISEVLLNENEDTNILKRLQSIVSRAEASVVLTEPEKYSTNHAWHCLHRIFAPEFHTQKLAEKMLTRSLFARTPPVEVLSTIGALLHFVVDSHGGVLPFLEHPCSFDRPRLKIDHETEQSLEILVSLRTRQRKGSLLDCIDRTTTPVGRKELQMRLKAPFNDKSLIEANLDLVSYLKDNPDFSCKLREILETHFKHDTVRSLQNLQLKHGGLWHLGSIYEAIRGFKSVDKLLQRSKDLIKLVEKPLLLEKRSSLVVTNDGKLDELVELLEAILPVEYINGDKLFTSLPKKFEGVGNLNPECNDELMKAASAYQKALNLRENMETYIRKEYFPDTNVVIKLINKKPLGPIIEIDANRDDLDALERSLEFTRIQALKETSKTGKRRYKYSKWSQLDQSVHEALSEYANLEFQAFQKVSEHVQEFRGELMEISQLVSLLDASLSFAVKASESNYTRPKIVDYKNDDDKVCVFKVKEGRHPVVEDFLLQAQKTYKPSSCQLLPNKNFIFLTGPNMGGKSTFLRSNALIVILSHIGSFVPASEAQISIVDQLFSRVGTSDNLAQNESSFMVEMKETAFILNNATRKSFAILDEVGRGTSHEDGIALAAGIVEYLLAEIGCRSIFATHFSDLGKQMSDLRVQKLKSQVLVKEDDPLFTFQFVPGVSDNSYGLFVAESAGIPSSVIKKAHLYKLRNK